MKIENRTYEVGGGVSVFQVPPVKCKISGHGVTAQLAVAVTPPPTAQTSPDETMKTEYRLFSVPLATPFVHMNPFQ
jgi:hypothetical protein